MNSILMNLLNLAMILGVILFFGAIAAAPIMVGGWILYPLDRAAKHRKRSTRFSILDFFGLVFLVQMPMALIHSLVPRSEAGIYWTFMVMGWIASAAVWAAAVKTFSNAGISKVWTRAFLVFLVLPMAYFAPFAIVIMVIVAINSVGSGNILILSSISACLVGGIVFAGISTRRIARPLVLKMSNPFGEDLAKAVETDEEQATGAPSAAYYPEDGSEILEHQREASVRQLFQNDDPFGATRTGEVGATDDSSAG